MSGRGVGDLSMESEAKALNGRSCDGFVMVYGRKCKWVYRLECMEVG